jgi:hypothetical protein
MHGWVGLRDHLHETTDFVDEQTLNISDIFESKPVMDRTTLIWLDASWDKCRQQKNTPFGYLT